MTSRYPPVGVKVFGPLACFSRPELKVERMTYDVMTPSAAVGVLEAIFWRPEMRWRVEEIWVMKPIHHTSIVRNECRALPNTSRVMKTWTETNGAYNVEDSNHRDPRHMRMLKDVSYVIWAQVDVQPDVDADPAKFREQFMRRVQRGNCFHRPYLGLREFAAFFEPHTRGEQPIDYSADLGWMLHSMAWTGPNQGVPRFFPAKLTRGVLHVPSAATITQGGNHATPAAG